VEETVYLNPEGGDQSNFDYDEKKQALTFKNGSDSIALFKKVKVELSVDDEKQELVLKCLDPPVHTPTQATSKEGIKRKEELITINNNQSLIALPSSNSSSSEAKKQKASILKNN
jgi:hypothetical protein